MGKQTKPSQASKPNLSIQTKPAKPNLLIKAVNAWVRSAFGNVYSNTLILKITICQKQIIFRIIVSLNLYHEMEIHGVVADLSMKISEYENYMTIFKHRTQ